MLTNREYDAQRWRAFQQNFECTNGCWNWTGTKTQLGYGIFSWRVGKRHVLFRAHRLMWSKTFGGIPKGVCVLHQCDNRGCVNPDHLCLGTQLDNIQDRVRKGRNAFAIGAANNNAKLTENQVRSILQSKESGPKIAKRFGVHPSTIRIIRCRKNWSHVVVKGATC